jgi:hypothetical protein
MPNSVYDFEAIAEVLRRGKPKASTADHGEMKSDSGIKWCPVCATLGWRYVGNGKWQMCHCGNPNGNPCPAGPP